MKKLFSILAALFLIATGLQAQISQTDFNHLQNDYAKHKRQLVYQYIHFKDTVAAAAFWKVYDNYEADRKNLGEEFIGNLQNYAKNYETLTDAQTDALVKKAGSINLAYEKLYSEYYDKEKKAVGSLTAGQWIQLESFLNGYIKLSILNQIPFIGQINRQEISNSK